MIWSSSSAGSSPVQKPGWTTLQPGQSYSQTDSWDGLSSVSPTSASTARSRSPTSLTPRPDSASFQIGTTVNPQLATSLTTDKPSIN